MGKLNRMLVPLLVCAMHIQALAQGTEFTYQGRLHASGVPANGTYDLQFSVYDSGGGASVIAGPVTNSGVAVANGLFTVPLDFGAGVFTGPARWLQIGVRTNGNQADFTLLLPRQPLTATPYSITASNLTGSVSASQLNGTISSNNIGAGSITTTMLALGAVGSNQLASGAVTTSALAEGAVTAAKVATVSNWSPVIIANPTPASGEYFGLSIDALGSDRVLIGAAAESTGAAGAGAAYLFNTNGSLLTTFNNPTPATFELFGSFVAAVGNDRVLIGSPSDNTGAPNVGAAFLFNTNGALVTTFTNPTPAAADNFGFSVAAMGNDRVLIGANLDDRGAPNAGAAYLFSTNGALLTTITNPTPAANDHFGWFVAAVGTDRALIAARYDDTGASNAGAAYLFSTNGTLLVTITNPTPETDENFGWWMAAMGTDHVLVGANYAGAAYLFSTNGYLITTFTNATPAADDLFGTSVAAVGTDRVLVGAYHDSTGANAAGAAYLFNTNGTLLFTFTNPTPANTEFFGLPVAALGSGRVLIGAISDDMGTNDAGAAYLFNLESFTPGLVADGVNAGSVSTSSLEDGAVTVAKLDPTIGVWTRSGNNVYRELGNVGIGTESPGAKLDVVGQIAAGYITFGYSTGHKLLLFGNDWGFGIQNNVLYSRVGPGGGFAWYAGGVHNDTTYNSGGGVTRMTLDSGGLTINGAFVSASDRGAKENFLPVTPGEMLEKVVALPISNWNFKNDPATRHVGPMAQDFYRAFRVGPDDKHIATVDADGVALAAIQGLNQKLEEELRRRNGEVEALQKRIERLEQMLERK